MAFHEILGIFHSYSNPFQGWRDITLTVVVPIDSRSHMAEIQLQLIHMADVKWFWWECSETYFYWNSATSYHLFLQNKLFFKELK